ncbi:MAG TPA: hypothetical protein VGE37_14280 [Archangium sp.]
MAQVRVVLNFIVAFALFAVLLSSWIGPNYIRWDNTLGSGKDGMCICSEQALLGAKTLVSYQMTGTLVGAGIGLIAGIAWVVMRRNKAPAAPPPAAS